MDTNRAVQNWNHLMEKEKGVDNEGNISSNLTRFGMFMLGAGLRGLTIPACCKDSKDRVKVAVYLREWADALDPPEENKTGA